MSAEHLSFRVCRYPSHTPNYAGLESFQTGHHFTHFMSQLWAVSSTSLIENQMNSQAASPLIFYQRSIKWPAFQLFQSSAFFHLNQPSSSYVDNWFVILSIYFHLFLITVWIRLISFNCFLCANSSWLMAGSPQPLQHGPTVPISMPWHAYHPIHPSINEDSKWTKKDSKWFQDIPYFPYISNIWAFPWHSLHHPPPRLSILQRVRCQPLKGASEETKALWFCVFCVLGGLCFTEKLRTILHCFNFI